MLFPLPKNRVQDRAFLAPSFVQNMLFLLSFGCCSPLSRHRALDSLFLVPFFVQRIVLLIVVPRAKNHKSSGTGFDPKMVVFRHSHEGAFNGDWGAANMSCQRGFRLKENHNGIFWNSILAFLQPLKSPLKISYWNAGKRRF